MKDKLLDIGDRGTLTAWARWRPDPGCPERPDPVIDIQWIGHEPWYYMAVMMDRLLIEYSRIPGTILDESLVLGTARFISGGTEIALEVTGQTFEDHGGWPISRLVARIHDLYPDQRASLFEPASLPLRVFASATDRFRDHACQLTVEFEEAEEAIRLPSVSKWLADRKFGTESQVSALLGTICSEAALHFEDTEPETGVESDLDDPDLDRDQDDSDLDPDQGADADSEQDPDRDQGADSDPGPEQERDPNPGPKNDEA